MKPDMAARLWKLRQRFGIAAPRVAVTSHIAWYWRWIGVAILLGISAASAAWIYDAGRRFAGFDSSQVQDELTKVRHELQETRAELDRLRAVANAADSRLAMERAAEDKLSQQIRALESDNAHLKEDLATFESVISSAARTGPSLSIYRFKVEPDVLPGEFRYRVLLLTPITRPEREFKGRLELVVSLTEAGRSAMMTFPQPGDSGAAAFNLGFKYFTRVEGTFRVSPKAKVESVQVRVYEAGSSQPKTTQSVSVG